MPRCKYWMQRGDKRPILSDLREGGGWDAEADVIIAKHRNGPLGTVSLYYDAGATTFRDAQRHTVNLSGSGGG